MSKPTILVTGAAGNTGRVIAAELRRERIPFVAMTHSATRQADFKAGGIDAVLGDFDSPATLTAALRGIQKAYMVCTPDEKLVPRETAFIQAAQQAGVEHIVMCSAYLSGEAAESQNLRSHGVIEATLKASGIAYTIIRPVGFMQTFTLFVWDMVQKANAISLPAGDGGMALVDVRDVARVGLKALTEDGHAGKVYDVTGPENLTMSHQAAILSRVLGREITYLPADERELARIMAVLGVTATPTEHVLKIFRMQREHRLEMVLPTLCELGIEPTSYEQFLQDYLAGRTTGGNSFEPPNTLRVRLYRLIGMMMLRLRVVRDRQRAERTRRQSR